MDKTILSWFTLVYIPVIKVIDKHMAMKHFKRRTKNNMYVNKIKFWDDFIIKFGNDYSLDDVATPFILKFGKPFWKRIIKRIQKMILKKRNTNSLT